MVKFRQKVTGNILVGSNLCHLNVTKIPIPPHLLTKKDIGAKYRTWHMSCV
jgi:hypothetical protein